ncbi:uncharacterized protein LOC132193673 [Neocloeon triangulifer]|uniref:uncharacterized protein LOC132193673 n=1 Tax=Neocloeon triangulifer TaxID=2078957 RepID=UPI00286F192E|nr:uncharacterized protein LOC132193673 [Neocloeon triangulifer]
MYAREAAWRVKEKRETDRREQERQEREREEREQQKHQPKPRQRQKVASNTDAALFAAEQKKINDERKARLQRELLERQQKILDEMALEDEETQRRRETEKEQLQQSLRRRSEEHKNCFRTTTDHELAAQRALQFQREHPELFERRQNSRSVHRAKSLKADSLLPGTKEAALRVRKFLRVEKEKKLKAQQQQEETRRARKEHHKEVMQNIRRQRSLSTASARERRQTEFLYKSFDEAKMDQQLEEIKARVENALGRIRTANKAH